MAARAAPQHSATSLARYAVARQPDVDLFNGSTSRDYCNSFWGLGDAGANIMFARMRGASKTTDELRNFWNERCLIEEEYAAKLAKLAKAPIGGDEIGELRSCLDTLRIETEKQAESHLHLSQQIRDDLEAPTAHFHQKQINHRRTVQAPLERKFKEKQVQESYVKKSREKYEGDCMRINSYTQQATYMQGTDLAKVQQKLQRTIQTMQGNERDFAKFTKELLDLQPTWEREYKDFCDSCQDTEEERLDFMKDILWAYANAVSTICVADDQSCERVRTALDQLEPEKDVENFVNEYGTGNAISQPQDFVPTNGVSEPQMPPSPLIRTVQFPRISNRPQQAYPLEGQNSIEQGNSHHINGDHSYNDVASVIDSVANMSYTSSRGQSSPPHTSPPSHPPPPVPEPQASLTPMINTAVSTNSRSASPAIRNNRVSQPLPMTPGTNGPGRSQTPPPPLPTQQSSSSTSTTQSSGNRVLFYVKALYDYTATIQEEFDFQAGDVIAVTATPDDGWWSGELLDEARREEGRHVFPSNFVCLF